ncbi:anthranilate synthase component I family protein [Isoalcanivorax beigongshangi]|uniref:Anthranilate synthase component I family protein n=1 Tax=Isoalcanivorax beigongshangi TaxID=3238810 RepID=A0ABV4AJH2_9GAMM
MTPLLSPTAVIRQGSGWGWGTTVTRRWLLAPGQAALSVLESAEQWRSQSRSRVLVGALQYDLGRLQHGADAGYRADDPLLVVHGYETWQRGEQPPAAIAKFRLSSPFAPLWTAEQYQSAFSRVQDYLAAGDCYQVNLAQCFQAGFEGSSYSAWRALITQHDAPHAGYFEYGLGALLSVSPERLLRIDHQRQMITEPIKGTRPRGTNKHEDRALAADLLSSPKDRTENLMIVDLLRNDLGQVCQPGSVQARPLFELRQFSNVQHLVSTVRGTLSPAVSEFAALLATFPGGSITGAPKRRAMEIIRELEGGPRRFYCGSLFIRNNEGLDANILIRTLEVRDGLISCHGGGGLVMDSEGQAEYEESVYKVGKLMAALV